METKTGSVIDAIIRNRRDAGSYPNEVVVTPLVEAIATVTKAHEQKVAIDADRRLTPQGKAEARQAARQALRDAITKWHEPKLVELDADITSQRMALMPKGPEPDARKVDHILERMRKNTLEDNAYYYEKASDPDRVLMEVASAALGPDMQKTADGLRVWQPLLSPQTVQESVIARARATNPAGVKRLQELESIRDIHKTVAAHAVAEINEVFAD